MAEDRLHHGLLPALVADQDDPGSRLPWGAHRTPARDRARSYSASAAGHDLIPRLLRRVLPVVRGHRGAQVAVARPAGPRARAIASSSRGEVPVDPVPHELLDAAARPADDREPGRPRLQRGDAEGLQPAGGDVDVRGGVPVGQLLAGDPARKGDHASSAVPGDVPLQPAALAAPHRARPGAAVRRRRPAPARGAPPAAAAAAACGRPGASPTRIRMPCAVVGAPRGSTRPARPSGPRRCRWAAPAPAPAGPMMRCSGAAATPETAFMATPRSAQRPTYPATRRARLQRPEHAVPGHGRGQPQPRRDPGGVHGERADHPHVHVRDVEPAVQAGAGAARAGRAG